MAHKDKINRIAEFEGNHYNWCNRNLTRFSEVQFSPRYTSWCMFLKDNTFFFLTLRLDILSGKGSETFASCEWHEWDENKWGKYCWIAILLTHEGTC